MMLTNIRLLGTLLLLLAPLSFASKCIPPISLAEQFAKSDSVFVAKVTRIYTNKPDAEFTIEDFYKGTEKPKQFKMTSTPMNYWFDKIIFAKDQRYLAFYEKGKQLAWSICAKNIYLLDKYNQAMLNKIMQLQAESMQLEYSLPMQRNQMK